MLMSFKTKHPNTVNTFKVVERNWFHGYPCKYIAPLFNQNKTIKKRWDVEHMK